MKLVQSELYVNIIQHDGPYWKVNNSWGFRGYKGGNELFTLFKYPTFNAGYFATQHQTLCIVLEMLLVYTYSSKFDTT